MNGILAYKNVSDSKALSESPVGLIIMLYDGAANRCRDAARFCRSKDQVSKNENVRKAMNIIVEGLIGNLTERTSDVSKRLEETYMFWLAQIAEAHKDNLCDLFDTVAKEIDTVSEAWKQIDGRI